MEVSRESKIRRLQQGFSLIELLIVIAVISLLSAILFPAFARAKLASKKISCLSNMRQLGIALSMYMSDSDETCFFFAHNVDLSRANPQAPFGATRENRWWNQISPYRGANQEILRSPSDPVQLPSPLEDGTAITRPLVKRSYVANRAAEALQLSVIDRPSEIVVIAIKGKPFDDSWYEPPKNLYDKPGFNEPVLALDLQFGGCNNVFFDGHAKWLSKGQLRKEQCGLPYSGVDLMRAFPIPLVPGRTPWHANCPN